MFNLENFKKKDIFVRIKKFALVVLGTVILSFGTGVFIIPFNLVVGGMSSMAIILNNIIGVEFLTVDIYVTVITWTFFFIGLIVLGKTFALKTLISTIVYPAALSLFMRFASPDLFGGFFYLAGYDNEIAILLAALFGGVCVGTGCAVTFLGGGSTGGIDIIALSLSKRFKKLKSSLVLFTIDTTLIILGIFINKNFVLTLLGIVSAFISALVVDKIFLGESRAFIANIVSDKHDEINRAIIEKVRRTTTVISAVGGYSGTPKTMLMVSFSMRQYTELIAVVSKIDQNAFITVHRAHEINGEGWTYGEHD